MSPERFGEILRELLDENPFAIRPFLKVARISYTDDVPTMAVTCEESPTLKVNLGFVERSCRSDAEVKAVILHEFLHILLRHTGRKARIPPEEHLAMDAVINAIIHRQVGPEASAMMAHYYEKAEGLERLLRPPLLYELNDIGDMPDQVDEAWAALYAGKLVVDDIRELAATMGSSEGNSGPGSAVLVDIGHLLGNHADMPDAELEKLSDVLSRTMRMMNGNGIWRSPGKAGVGAYATATDRAGSSEAIAAWERRVLAVLKRHLLPDCSARAKRRETVSSMLPVLSTQDRRAFARAQWSDILPMASWDLSAERPAGSAQIYLDVSGSMYEELPLVIGLLGRLRQWIKSPFWAFSDEVKPARIVGGRLVTETTGGTSLSCVLTHIAATRPESAVIVTDGFSEEINPELMKSVLPTRIHALVTRCGSTTELDKVHIPCTQLPEVPR